VIHSVASFAKKTGNNTGQKPLAISNRRNQESRQNPRQCWIAAKGTQYLPDRCGQPFDAIDELTVLVICGAVE